MESADPVVDGLSTEALASIADSLQALVTEANESGYSHVAVKAYDLDALLQLLRITKNASDYYRRSHGPRD